MSQVLTQQEQDTQAHIPFGMSYLLMMLEDFTSPLDDERFRKGAVRGSIALTFALFLDVITSLVMMTVKSPSSEGNTAFRQLYMQPSVGNLLVFIYGQLIFIVPILLGIFVPLTISRIDLRPSVKLLSGSFTTTLRLLLIVFAGLRIYGMYTNILATLIDLPFGYIVPVLIFALALFYLLKYSLAFDFKVSNDV